MTPIYDNPNLDGQIVQYRYETTISITDPPLYAV